MDEAGDATIEERDREREVMIVGWSERGVGERGGVGGLEAIELMEVDELVVVVESETEGEERR